MAKPTTYSGSLVAIYLEGTPPGTFVRPCGLTSHQAQFTKNMTDINVPDCDDPDLPSWVGREVASLDFSASGSGVLAAEALPVWWAAYNTLKSVKARIYIGKATDIAHGYYWSGNVHVSGFEANGTGGERAQVTINVVSDGEMTLTKITT